MSAQKGSKREGEGFKFGGQRASAIKARLAALKEEQERTGRISIFDVVKQ